MSTPTTDARSLEAEAEGADMLVVGAGNHPGIGSLRLGSVSQHAVASANASVIVVVRDDPT